jgi:hypothetical protein
MGMCLRYFVLQALTPGIALQARVKPRNKSMQTLLFGIWQRIKPLYLRVGWFTTSWQLCSLNSASATTTCYLVQGTALGQCLRELKSHANFRFRLKVKKFIRGSFGASPGLMIVTCLQQLQERSRNRWRFGMVLVREWESFTANFQKTLCHQPQQFVSYPRLLGVGTPSVLVKRQESLLFGHWVKINCGRKYLRSRNTWATGKVLTALSLTRD